MSFLVGDVSFAFVLALASRRGASMCVDRFKDLEGLNDPKTYHPKL